MLKKELQNWDFNARIKHVFYSYVEVTIPAGTNKWCILASLFTEERRFKITYVLISYIVNYLSKKLIQFIFSVILVTQKILA